MKALLALLATSSLFLSGCAAVGTDACVGMTAYSVTPTTVTVDHMAAPPANQQQYIASSVTTYPKGRAIPAVIASPYQTTWMEIGHGQCADRQHIRADDGWRGDVQRSNDRGCDADRVIRG